MSKSYPNADKYALDIIEVASYDGAVRIFVIVFSQTLFWS